MNHIRKTFARSEPLVGKECLLIRRRRKWAGAKTSLMGAGLLFALEMLPPRSLLSPCEGRRLCLCPTKDGPLFT